MSIADRFTANFKMTIQQAAWLCLDKQGKSIQSDDLFLALFLIPKSLALKMLEKLKITKESVEQTLGRKLNAIEEILKQRINANNLDQAISEKEILELKMDEAAIQIIEKAAHIALNYSHNYIGTEHLLASLLELKNPLLFQELAKHKIQTKTLADNIDNALKTNSSFKELTDIFKQARSKNQKGLKTKKSYKSSLLPSDGKKDSILEYFTINLTNEKMQKKLDPIIGREEEIERLINILSRRHKSNPILIGQAGVGKTAIVEGLAQKIYQENVPDLLLNKKILKLDLSNVVAGTIYRGEFESRMKGIIEEAQEEPNVILFIDEIHNLIGAGSASGSLDAANILKPALSRGEISCIGATTLEEYKKYFEGDRTLERRFQPIFIKEPNAKETIKVLKGIKKNYENYHRINISNEAIIEAVKLSDRFMPHKIFPDKAIDLIDEVASKLKILKTKTNITKKIKSTAFDLEKTIRKKETLVQEEKYEQAAKFKKQERQLKKELRDLEKKKKKELKKTVGKIHRNDILKIVKDITKIPFLETTSINKKKLLNIEKVLNQKIIGQEKAIREIALALQKARLGLADSERPLASFIFLGPSGVGKTETAKVIAEDIFGDRKALVRIDMSEFRESFNISKLIGSPAGYVGYKDTNLLADQIKNKPYSVILFDEMEKAHPDIFNLLLQILEDGILTDATGRLINFKNTIIILTSNLGIEEFNRKASFGFELSSKTDQEKFQQEFDDLKENILKNLREKCKPEFLNRIHKILIFEPLSKKNIEKIIEKQVQELNLRLIEKKLKLQLSNAAKKLLAQKSFIPEQGARAIRRVIQQNIEESLVENILHNKFKPGDLVKVGMLNNKIGLKT